MYKKIKSTIPLVGATFLLASTGSEASLVLLDNFAPASGDTADGNGNYISQSFTPSTAALGANDTVVANSPLTASVFLQSATFVRAASGNETAGELFVNVYLGDGPSDVTTATFIGSSTNSNNVNAAASLTELTWVFSNLVLDSDQEYTLAFSTDQAEGTSVGARIRAGRNTDGSTGFTSIYDGGTARGGNTNLINQDVRFQVQFDTVPEPSSTMLMGLAGWACLWRRKRA